MRTALLPLAALGLALATTTGTIAVTADFSTVDSDRNGIVSWTEFQLLFPEVTEEEFKSADIDADGVLSPDEYAAFNVTGSIGVMPLAPPAQAIPESLTLSDDE